MSEIKIFSGVEPKHLSLATDLKKPYVTRQKRLTFKNRIKIIGKYVTLMPECIPLSLQRTVRINSHFFSCSPFYL